MTKNGLFVQIKDAQHEEMAAAAEVGTEPTIPIELIDEHGIVSRQRRTNIPVTIRMRALLEDTWGEGYKQWGRYRLGYGL